MFRWRASDIVAIAPQGVDSTPSDHPISPAEAPARDTTETRRAAQIHLFSGIGEATERNLALGKILRSAFGLVHDMAAFSSEFDGTAEATRMRADQFVASVCNLQSQSDLIEERLATASSVVDQAHSRSQSALASVEDLTGAIGEIERVVAMIANIAAQTNLLALNATIEAARAGAAGAGFRVVAGEVKALSQQTERATQDIVASVKRIRERAKVNTTEVKDFDQVIGSLQDVFVAMRAAIVTQGDQTREIGIGSEEVATLAQKVRVNAGRLQELGGSVTSMTSAAEQAVDKARQAFAQLMDRATIVLNQAEAESDADTTGGRWPIVLSARLSLRGQAHDVRVIDLSANAMQIETAADFPMGALGEAVGLDIDHIGLLSVRLLSPATTGFETAVLDASPTAHANLAAKVEEQRAKFRPYIERVQAVAAEAVRLIETAIEAGRITEEALFNTNYRRDGDSEPPQYMTPAVRPLEECVGPLLEAQLTIVPNPDFCLIQDRNGFNPVHNRRYSQPPRSGDAQWNLRHSRMRRVFDDRVGLAASRNLRPFFVQSYARDMGDVIETRMEFDAPVFIKGRHWGVIRMAYQLADATPAKSSARTV